MRKAVLISIRPKWCEMIASGKKTIEVRKNRPKLETPFKSYIYCTLKGSKEFFVNDLHGDVAAWNRGKWFAKKGMVIGEFICDNIFKICLTDEGYDFDTPKMTGLKYEEMEAYLGRKDGFGWHISDLVIYDNPKELSDFRMLNMECLRHGEDGVPVCEKGIPCQMCRVMRPPQSWYYVEEEG